ncbi:MAG: polysulfide reductase NrfD [Proteobacteria bacterium]|nr:polysulfide reductase NrfD [Pseudomonadota bacterium]
MNTNRNFIIWLLFLAATTLLGLYAAVQIFSQGHILFNANDVIMWTLPLGVYVFLALAGSGIALIASIPQIFGLERYKLLTKRLVFMAVATLIGSFVAIGLELGSIFHAVYFIASPNPSSPIWWMAVIYTIELVALVVKFIRIQVNDWNSGVSKLVGIVSFFAAIFGPLVLGSVFGFTEARPLYFGTFMPIFSLTIALVLGCALITIYNVIYHKTTGDTTFEEKKNLFNEIGIIFAFVAGLALLFYLLRVGLKTAVTVPDFGTGKHFELVLGLAMPCVIMTVKSWRESIAGKVIASIIALVSIMGATMEILISGQSRPTGPKAEGLPEFLSYFPSIWEWMVLILAVGVVLALYTLGEKYFQLSLKPE